MELIRSPDTLRRNRIPPGQRATDGWPVLHYDGVPRINVSEWRFRLFGLVRCERELSFPEFLSLPQVRILSDVHCVTGWSKLNNMWEGVRASALKDLVEVLPEAHYAVIHAHGGFTTNLSLDDLFQEDVLFAAKHNDMMLTPDHGYPVRLVVPRLYF